MTDRFVFFRSLFRSVLLYLSSNPYNTKIMRKGVRTIGEQDHMNQHVCFQTTRWPPPHLKQAKKMTHYSLAAY